MAKNKRQQNTKSKAEITISAISVIPKSGVDDFNSRIECVDGENVGFNDGKLDGYFDGSSVGITLSVGVGVGLFVGACGAWLISFWEDKALRNVLAAAGYLDSSLRVIQCYFDMMR